MVWPPLQHRVRPINCFEERAHLNLLMGFDVIAAIEKTASVEGHKVLRLSSPRLLDGVRQSSRIPINSIAATASATATAERCTGSYGKIIGS
jgi:hypothetical protein